MTHGILLRRAAVVGVLALLLVGPALAAAEKRVEADPNTDFSIFKTFALKDGVAQSRQPEVNNALTIETVTDQIRSSLFARGLKETSTQPDLVVTFNVTENGQRGAPPPGTRGAVKLNAGTLVIDMRRPGTGQLVWRGTYTDSVNSPAALATRLPGYAKKLLADFPPKKK